MSEADMSAKVPPLPPEVEQALRQQVIDEDRPGPILRDFATLLEFVGDGLPAAGKHHLLPMSRLGELNARLSRLAELRLKRPQQRSYPYINGLYLLLRATGLGRVAGVGSKARLTLDAGVLASWRGLNPTERYFTLLEAWLVRARAEMIGLRGGWGDSMHRDCVLVLKTVPPGGLVIDGRNEYAFSGEYALHAALADLFGLLDVQARRPEVGKPWCPARVKRTPFGEAMLAVLSRLIVLGGTVHTFDFSELFGTPGDEEEEDEEDEDEEDEQGPEAEEADESDAESDDEWADEPATVTFGQLQPLFQPYFPEWRSNLVIPQAEFRDGVFVFKASLGRVWRRIAIPAGLSLNALADEILDSVDFDNDHLYRFTYKDRFGSEAYVDHPYDPEGLSGLDVRVGQLPLAVGDGMTFLFDFGDNWLFDVTLERIDPPNSRLRKAKLLESHGEAPVQYPRWHD